MRIGIDARLPSVRVGGISEYTSNLIAALAEIDSDDEFTILQAAGDPVMRVPAGVTNFERVDVWTPCHHPMERLLLASELRNMNLDVLHSPDFIPPVSGATRRVITVHDLGFLDHPDHFTEEGRRHYAGQIEWAVADAAAIAADSDFVRTQVIDRFGVPPAKVSAIPLAAAPRFFEPIDDGTLDACLERHSLAHGFVLFVGTIEPRKNVMTLIKAHDALRESRRVDTPLALVGSPGWLCDDVLDAIRTRPDSVRHLGVVTAEDLQCLYARAGVLALPSIHEGFGLTMLEAMACGCPVVASTGGAVPEVAGDAAALVHSFDTGEWADALGRVLADHDHAASLRSRGRSRAAEFSWARTARETLRLYRP